MKKSIKILDIDVHNLYNESIGQQRSETKFSIGVASLTKGQNYEFIYSIHDSYFKYIIYIILFINESINEIYI